jgi:hypothetical protein
VEQRVHDIFISPGVHDFIDEKSIGDAEGVLLMDVRQKFLFFEGSP